MASALPPLVVAATAGVSPVASALPVDTIIGGYPLLMFATRCRASSSTAQARLCGPDLPKAGLAICLLACLLYTLCTATYRRWIGMF